jgi:hypothetical protein
MIGARDSLVGLSTFRHGILSDRQALVESIIEIRPSRQEEVGTKLLESKKTEGFTLFQDVESSVLILPTLPKKRRVRDS